MTTDPTTTPAIALAELARRMLALVPDSPPDVPASPASARPIYVDHEGKPTPAVDLMADLRASLEAAKARRQSADQTTPGGQTDTETQEANRG